MDFEINKFSCWFYLWLFLTFVVTWDLTFLFVFWFCKISTCFLISRLFRGRPIFITCLTFRITALIIILLVVILSKFRDILLLYSLNAIFSEHRFQFIVHLVFLVVELATLCFILMESTWTKHWFKFIFKFFLLPELWMLGFNLNSVWSKLGLQVGQCGMQLGWVKLICQDIRIEVVAVTASWRLTIDLLTVSHQCFSVTTLIQYLSYFFMLLVVNRWLILIISRIQDITHMFIWGILCNNIVKWSVFNSISISCFIQIDWNSVLGVGVFLFTSNNNSPRIWNWTSWIFNWFPVISYWRSIVMINYLLSIFNF